MRWRTGAAVLATAAGVAATTVAARRVMSRMPRLPGSTQEPDWLVATIYRAPTDITTDQGLPEPLARLGDAIDVQIRPAPGDRGTEVSVRPRLVGSQSRSARRDAWRTARLALREAKQLAETGEILEPDEPPTTRATLLNRPLEYAIRHAREEGRP